MGQLVFLLVGSEALRRRWYMLTLLALLLLALALLLLTGAAPAVVTATTALFGLLALLHGLLVTLSARPAAAQGGSWLNLARGLALAAIGALILARLAGAPLPAGPLAGLAFIVDGGLRIFGGQLMRFAAWRRVVLGGVLEVLLGLALLAGWPIPGEQAVPVSLGVLLLLSGAVLLQMSWELRRLEPEAAILLLSVFGGRGWQDNAPVLPDGGSGPAAAPAHPLTIHVWTPAVSAGVKPSLPVINRYVAAMDSSGKVSTGHCALEAGPLYISHYPANELAYAPDQFAQTMRATAENDQPGRFLPSLAAEIAEWCPPDQQLVFHHYDERRLRAYWAGYRQDDTYNTANRNCAICVAAALEAALEGRLASPRPWLRILRLLCNPDIWSAAVLRKHASSITWTPGSVLDYARALREVVEPHEAHPAQRLRRAARLLLGAWRRDSQDPVIR